MKSTSKMMVVAAVFLVAAAMLVMPAAARTATQINSGDTIFLYEEGLNLTPVNDGIPFDKLVRYTDDDPTKGIAVTISLTDSNDVDLMEDVASKVGSKTGRYFAGSSTEKNVFIEKPTVQLKPVLANSHSDSIDGKTVSSSAQIAFQLIAPDVGGNPVGAEVDIKLTTPTGGSVSYLGGVDLTNIPLTKTSIYTDVDAPAQKIYLNASDVDSGKYLAVAEWAFPQGFKDYADDSKSVSFEVSTDKLALSASKESVVRGNSFTVTITGESKQHYFLYIKSKGTLASSEYPFLAPKQAGVNDATAAMKNLTTEEAGFEGTLADVQTKADGTRVVEFRTNDTTKDETFTVKVMENTTKNARTDDVKVKVEKGSVTITAEGAGSYYFGEEIKLSGTNTEGDNVYLFLYGPNLGKDGNGVSLEDLNVDASKGGLVKASVESDDTWEYTWNTGDIDGGVLSEGSYTVYAVSAERNKGEYVYKGNLGDVQYATFSVNLRKGFITGASNVNTLAKGDDLKITGTAEGKPDQIYVWIFGKNFYGKEGIVQDSVSVEDDGTFEYKLEDTDRFAAGQYFVILQHPMAKADDADNVMWDPKANDGKGAMVAPGLASDVNLKNLQASDAATAVINAIDSANVDDTYTKLTFMVTDAWVRIDSIGDKAVGEKFTITGTTNLAVGDELNIDIQSAAFTATQKTQTSGFSGVSGTVKVVEGTDANKWSYEVDATNYKPDQYQVKVEGIDVSDATATATFNIVEAPPTTVQPTQSVTTVPTTGTATTTVPATTPTQPGFGALISLIGLGAVAFLVMRRN